MITNTTLPSQLEARSIKLNKTKNTISNSTDKNSHLNKTWGENTVDYYIGQALSQEYLRDEMLTLGRLKDGILTEKDYKVILNPLNTTNEDYQRFPATLRSYNIIKPVIEEYCGERLEKPLNPIVTIGNKQADNLFKKKLNEQVNGYLQQKFINELNQMGYPSGVDSKELPPMEDFIKSFTLSYDENKAIENQNIIDYIVYDLELDELQQEMYEDWLTYGRVCTDKDVIDSDLVYTRISPLDLYFPVNEGNKNIEDGSWGVQKMKYRSKFAVLDILRKDLIKEDLEWLEAQYNTTFSNSSSSFNSTRPFNLNSDVKTNLANEEAHLDGENFILWKVQWKSFRKVGILLTVDELGQPMEVDVDETYSLNKDIGDISIEWYYITEVWKGYRLDGLQNNEYKYFLIEPLPIQRTELNSNQKAKLQFGGRFEVDVDGRIISVVKTGYPYQVLYNTFHFQFEKVMNKSKDKMTIIPMGLMPNKPGWDIEKFMYYGDALGYLFVDESKPNALAALSAIRALDLSLGQYASKMWEFLQAIKNEFWDAVGMNRQRFGETNSSDGKAVNEQALFRASLITAEVNRKYDKFLERDYQALLDWSKIAWINGKKANFVRSDGNEALLDVEGEEHLGTDRNIFIKNSSKEYNKLKTMQNIALSLNQNGTQGSDIAALLDSNNMPTIKKILKDGEAIAKEYQMQLEKQKNDAIIQASQLAKEAEAMKQETAMYKADKDYDGIIDAQNIITERELVIKQFEIDMKSIEATDGEMEAFKRTLESAKLNIAQAKQNLEERKVNLSVIENQKNRDSAERIANKRSSAK